MTKEELKKRRFELHIDPKPSMDEYCIVDTEQEALTIYNNLGCIYYTSAPALCDLLNELDTENKKLVNLKEYLNEKIEMLEKSINKTIGEQKLPYNSPFRSPMNREYLNELKNDKRTYEYILEMIE